MSVEDYGREILVISGENKFHLIYFSLFGCFTINFFSVSFIPTESDFSKVTTAQRLSVGKQQPLSSLEPGQLCSRPQCQKLEPCISLSDHSRSVILMAVGAGAKHQDGGWRSWPPLLPSHLPMGMECEGGDRRDINKRLPVSFRNVNTEDRSPGSVRRRQLKSLHPRSPPADTSGLEGLPSVWLRALPLPSCVTAHEISGEF